MREEIFKLQEIREGVLGFAWVKISMVESAGDETIILNCIDENDSESVNLKSSPQWVGAALEGISAASAEVDAKGIEFGLLQVVGNPADTTVDAVFAAAQMAVWKLLNVENVRIVRDLGRWKAELLPES